MKTNLQYSKAVSLILMVSTMVIGTNCTKTNSWQPTSGTFSVDTSNQRAVTADLANESRKMGVCTPEWLSRITGNSRVGLSLSYGINEENAQAYGSVAMDNGIPYFVQTDMVTSNMALGPGVPWDNSGATNKRSLWNLREHVEMACHTAIPQLTANQKYGSLYPTTEAAVSDVQGGTASINTNLQNALFVRRTNGDTNFETYFGSNGVITKFTEQMEPSGTAYLVITF